MVTTLVGRLDLERYKATIKGLTQFGDRRQGTDRNRAAIDWIEAQLEELRLHEHRADPLRIHRPQVPLPPATRRGAAAAAPAVRQSGGGRRGGSPAAREGVRPRPDRRQHESRSCSPTPRFARINCQPDTPGPREEVYCTKVGTTHPDEMYIVGAHMDGHGCGEAANDDGSGTALVMELARVFSAPDVQTERSIRFVLWNNEETGLERRARLRRAAQGPAGQGRSRRLGQVSRSRSGSA